MCGIAGIFYFGTKSAAIPVNTGKIVRLLNHHRPGNQSFATIKSGKLFHSRLEMVGINEASNTAFSTSEILNFKNHLFSDKQSNGNAKLWNIIVSENCLPNLEKDLKH